MTPPPTSEFETIRMDACERMFARTPRLAMLVFEPTFAVLGLFVAFTAVEPWRRGAALALIASLVAMNLFDRNRSNPRSVAMHWFLAVGLIAITGGPLSPALPILVIGAVSAPSKIGHRAARMKSATSIVFVWTVTLLWPHGTAAWLSATCMTTLIFGAHVIGVWIRETSDVMLRSSLDARDELVRTHSERLLELTKLQERLANDLRNPLASIKGLACLVDLDPSRACERIAVLKKAVDRMQQILDEHLSFSRPLTPMSAESTDVQAILTAVVQLHAGVARKKKLTLDMSNTERVDVMGDPRKVRQMVTNLVAYAIDASTDGGTIELTARRYDERVHIGVRHRGIDLDAGVGLTIVRALAEQHGGSMRLTSPAEGGLDAEVDLPRGIVSERAF